MKRTLLCIVLFAGCVHGTRMEDFSPAHTPSGLHSILTISSGAPQVTGELLAVRRNGLMVGTPNRVVFVSFDRIQDGRFPAASRLRIGARRTPGPTKLKELSLLSRYPQGLEGDVLERLLEAYMQNEVHELR